MTRKSSFRREGKTRSATPTTRVFEYSLIRPLYDRLRFHYEKMKSEDVRNASIDFNTFLQGLHGSACVALDSALETNDRRVLLPHEVQR